MLRNLVMVVYLAAGAVIASNHHYFSHLHGVKHIVSAVLAVCLWPLIVLGVSLHLH